MRKVAWSAEFLGRVSVLGGILIVLVFTLTTWHSREEEENQGALSEARQRWRNLEGKLRSMPVRPNYSLGQPNSLQQQQQQPIPQRENALATAGMPAFDDERMQALGVLEKALGLGNPALAAALPPSLQKLIANSVADAENPQIQAWARASPARAQHTWMRQQKSGVSDASVYQRRPPPWAQYQYSAMPAYDSTPWNEQQLQHKRIRYNVASLANSPPQYQSSTVTKDAQLDFVRPDPQLDEELFNKDLGVLLLLAYIAILGGILSVVFYIIRSSTCLPKDKEAGNGVSKVDTAEVVDKAADMPAPTAPAAPETDSDEHKDDTDDADILGAGQRFLSKHPSVKGSKQCTRTGSIIMHIRASLTQLTVLVVCEK
jgi:hypothetical protein